MIKMDVFGVKQSCTDFLATFSRQNLGKASDMLPAIFFLNRGRLKVIYSIKKLYIYYRIAWCLSLPTIKIICGFSL